MNTTKRFQKKLLICGCCGEYFNTWPAYVDQDQDKGYGICRSCQGMIEDREKEQIEDAFTEVVDNVKPETREKILAKFGGSYDDRRVFVFMAIDKGWLKFQIGSN